MLNGQNENPDFATNNGSASSLLDTLETSVHEHLPEADYRTHLNVNSDPEFKAVAAAYTALDKTSGHKRSEALHLCRTRAWFALDETTRKVSIVSNACRLRWCPVCARKRQYLIRHQVEAWAEERPNLRFVTLTLRHSDEPLVSQLKIFEKFYRNFRRNKTVVQYVKGGIWFLEVKLNPKSGTWHPHYHMLVEGSYMPKSLLSRIWLETTGDSMIVDIRSAGNSKRIAAYVAKYSSKPAELCAMPKEDVLILMLALHGKKLASSFGSARCIKLCNTKKPLENKVRKICSWSTLKSLYAYVYDARLVWNAYIKREPLAVDVCLRETEAFLDNDCLEIDIPPPGKTDPLLWSE